MIMNNNNLNDSLENILNQYQKSFSQKIFSEETSKTDDLMKVFGLTQKIKSENSQYWGRELGKCWELLVKELCKQKCPEYQSGIYDNRKELCDLIVNKDAIDTKYRIGSGDSGTLNKFESNAKRLIELKYTPILLILRDDSLTQALTKCKNGGWIIKSDREAFVYIKEITNFDLQNWLQQRENIFNLYENG
jgi:hypothetical protein